MASIETPYRILVVCMGNICRSPMAEAVLRRAFTDAGLPVEVDSAGTGDWHVGEPAHPNTMRMLQMNGYALEHSARALKGSWLDQRDLVLTMDQQNRRALLALATSDQATRIRMFRSFDSALQGLPEHDEALNVPDPYYGTLEDYREVLTMIESAALGLVSYVEQVRTQ